MITITGVPFYDGIIEGFLFVPSKIADLMTGFGFHNLGFWFGLIIFVFVLFRLIFGWD